MPYSVFVVVSARPGSKRAGPSHRNLHEARSDEICQRHRDLTGIGGGTAEYHIFIGEPGALGHGVAKQASQLVLEYADKELRLEKVELFVNRENDAALHLYESLGFRATPSAGPSLKMVFQIRT